MSMARAISDLWLQPVRAERMAVFRISIGCVVLLDTLFAFIPDARDWFGREGLFSPAQYASWLSEWSRWSLLPIEASDEFVFAMLALLVVFSAMMVLGLGSRIACIAVWALLGSFHARNPHILNGGDTLLRCACFYLMLMPAGAAWSVDNLIRRKMHWPVNGWVPAWSLRLAQFQVLVVYFATAVEKLRGFKPGESLGDWIDGTAVYKAVTYVTMARFPGVFAALPQWLFMPASWLTLGLELLFAPLVLWKRTRWYALALGVGLHMGIFATMEVSHFSFTTLSYYWLLVPAAVLMDIAGKSTGESEPRRYTVFFDGMCPVCKRSKRWLERLDWLGRLQFADIHDRPRAEADLPLVGYADMLRQMYVKRPDGKYFGGFHAFRAIAAVLPLGWPVIPVLWLPGMALIGTRLYAFIARNRFKFAKCDNEFCSLHLKLLAGREIDDDVIARVVELHEKYRAAPPRAS